MKTRLKKIEIMLASVTMMLGVALSFAMQKPDAKVDATISAGTYSYSFVTNFSTYASSWGSTYTSHSVTADDLEASSGALPNASISFSSC